MFNNKRIMIAGTGTIGSAIAEKIINEKFQRLYLVDVNENAIYNIHQKLKHKKNTVPIVGDLSYDFGKKIFKKTKPNIIFFTAAWKHVHLAEENPDEYFRNNINCLVNAIENLNPEVEKFIFLSSDKANTPKGVYGKTKLECEKIINKLNDNRFIICQLPNVYGSSGSVVPLFLEQIKNGGPITITHPDAERFFISLDDTVESIINCCKLEGGYYVPVGKTKKIKIVDLANNLMKEKKVQIYYTGLRKGENIKERLL